MGRSDIGGPYLYMWCPIHPSITAVVQSFSEVGIYQRKQESKKTRKHAFDQESNQEKKENSLSTKKKKNKR